MAKPKNTTDCNCETHKKPGFIENLSHHLGLNLGKYKRIGKTISLYWALFMITLTLILIIIGDKNRFDMWIAVLPYLVEAWVWLAVFIGVTGAVKSANIGQIWQAISSRFSNTNKNQSSNELYNTHTYNEFDDINK